MALAGAATAQPTSNATNLGVMTLGYTYFNHPGADIKAHDDAVMACAIQAAKTRSYDEQNPVENTALVPTLINMGLGAYHHGAVGANLENCMVVRGWRVVSVPEAEGKDLASLPQAELAAKLAPWVGADTPHGVIVRAWQNDAALAGTIRYAFRPAHTNNGQLSLLSATGHDLTLVPPQLDPLAGILTEHYFKTLEKPWSGFPLKPGAVASAPSEGGVLVAGVRGGSIYGADAVVFSREGSTPDEIVSQRDRKLDFASFGAPHSLFANRNVAMVAIAVPPGRWRMSGVYSLTHGGLNFCLGAPSFDVKAGDVIYVGSFDFAGAFGPDMNLAPVQTWFAGKPQASMVKAAAYTNGSTGPCGGSGIYAFEYPGAPFVSDFAPDAIAASGQPKAPVAR